VILAGGYGTRLSEETTVRPKPMVELGERPILWHIMKGYEAHGVREFVICCGYKLHVIKNHFVNYSLRHADVTVDLAANEVQLEAHGVEPWRVHLVETGDTTMTGGRLRRVAQLVSDRNVLLHLRRLRHRPPARVPAGTASAVRGAASTRPAAAPTGRGARAGRAGRRSGRGRARRVARRFRSAAGS
jgi:GTP:adenosylcobinamide-phosphate guanylyltransferase